MTHLVVLIIFIVNILFFCFTIHAQDVYTSKSQLSDEEIRLLQNEYLEKLNKRNDMYLEMLQNSIISGVDTIPLIELKNDRKCLLTIKDYNSIVRFEYSSRWKEYLSGNSDTIPKIDKNDLQQEIINFVLKKAYIYDQWLCAKNTKLFNDSLQNEKIRNMNNFRSESFDSLLKIKYQQYYQDLFSEKNNSLYCIITSTDTSSLNKVLSLIKCDSAIIGQKMEKNKSRLFKDGYTADLYKYDDLTDQMKTIADSLNEGSWSKIINMQWGYFIIGLYHYNMKHEVLFADAVDQLIYLPPKDENENTVSEQEANDFFNNNKHLFEAEDTFYLNLKIVPDVYIENSQSKNTGSQLPVQQVVSKLNCKSIDLPMIIKERINFGKDSCIGVLNAYNGKWSVCLLDKKKGKSIRFEECKDKVKSLILSNKEKTALANQSLIRQAKEDNRSYELFEKSFMKVSTDEENDNLNNKIKKWAANNIKIYSKFFL